jgi:hypothetical protein
MPRRNIPGDSLRRDAAELERAEGGISYRFGEYENLYGGCVDPRPMTLNSIDKAIDIARLSKTIFPNSRSIKNI